MTDEICVMLTIMSLDQLNCLIHLKSELLAFSMDLYLRYVSLLLTIQDSHCFMMSTVEVYY